MRIDDSSIYDAKARAEAERAVQGPQGHNGEKKKHTSSIVGRGGKELVDSEPRCTCTWSTYIQLFL